MSKNEKYPTGVDIEKVLASVAKFEEKGVYDKPVEDTRDQVEQITAQKFSFQVIDEKGEMIDSHTLNASQDRALSLSEFAKDLGLRKFEVRFDKESQSIEVTLQRYEDDVCCIKNIPSNFNLEGLPNGCQFLINKKVVSVNDTYGDIDFSELREYRRDDLKHPRANKHFEA